MGAAPISVLLVKLLLVVFSLVTVFLESVLLVLRWKASQDAILVVARQMDARATTCDLDCISDNSLGFDSHRRGPGFTNTVA